MRWRVSSFSNTKKVMNRDLLPKGWHHSQVISSPLPRSRLPRRSTPAWLGNYLVRVQFFCRAPKALKIVVAAGGRREDVHHEIHVVEQHPFGLLVAFNVVRV